MTYLTALGAGTVGDAGGSAAVRQFAAQFPVLGPLPPRLLAPKASSGTVR
jgi:hypothetical protein